MAGYSEGKHDDPADTHDRLVKVGTKYQATAPAVADGDNVYFLVDTAGRLLIAGAVAHDEAHAGNSLSIGGKALTGNASAVANNDMVNALFDQYGKQGVFISEKSIANRHATVRQPTDALSNTIDVLGTYGIGVARAPDTSYDLLRTLMDAAPGLGVLAAAPYTPGSSDTKAERVVTATDSSVRSTMKTPTSGKKIRVISVHLSNGGATGARLEVYFGTGANIGTNSTSVIFQAVLDLDTVPNATQAWPDGGGPVGSVDEVLSIRTSVDITTNGEFIVHYREE